MKTIFFRSKVVAISTIVLVALSLGACGLFSVPNITNAGNNKIVNIGDSIFALSGGISNYIHSYAGKTFRRYATTGAEIKGSNIVTSFDISKQYARARSHSLPIDTIFMDGGGNDILIPATTAFDPYNCKRDWWEPRLSSSCKALIDDVYVDTVTLLNQMGRDGVKNIIFLGYYRIKNGLFGSTTLNDAVDYGNLRLSQAVANATAASNYRVFIDPRPYIVSSDIIVDGVHPSDSGSRKLAGLIWAKLKLLPY
jgi:lysophospholipase L1-like esterase